MSKNSEKMPLIDNLQEKVEDARAVAEQSRAKVESFVRKRPIESAGMFFLAGLLFGLVIGIVASRSD